MLSCFLYILTFFVGMKCGTYWHSYQLKKASKDIMRKATKAWKKEHQTSI